MIIVDRIEDQVAVCEADGIMLEIPLSSINGNIREGDVLRKSGDGSIYFIDPNESISRHEQISKRFDAIKARKRKGGV